MNSCGIFAKNIWQFTKGKAPRNTSWDIRRELSEEEGGITASWDGWQQLSEAFRGMRQSGAGKSRWGCHSQGLVAGGQGVHQSHVGAFSMSQVGKFASS